MFLATLGGSVVTKTESGLGCGNDWPLCHGKFVPAHTLASMIEYSHRAVSGAAGLFSLAAFIAFWMYRKNRKDLQLYSLMALIFVMVQAVMGAMAVIYPTSSAVMALHFGFSLIAFASSIMLVLGIREELLPRDLAEARRLQEAIFSRQQQPSAVGQELTRVLFGLLDGRLPRWIDALAPAMARRYIGDRVADMIGIPTPRGTDHVISLLVVLTRIMSLGRRFDPIPRWLSRRLGRAMLEGLLLADRKGERVPFRIPDSLGGVPELAAVNSRVAAVRAGRSRGAWR